MRKTIEIDGKNVQLASHGATAIFYRKEFGSDFFADIISLAKGFGDAGKGERIELSDLDLETLDLTVIYQLTYIFAYCANKDIPPYIEWLESFEEFPIAVVMEPIIELMYSLLERKKKQKMISTQVKKN